MADHSVAGTFEERLERGDIVYFPTCPFPLATGDDHQFLLQQRLASRAHKNISYDPKSGKTGGYLHESSEQAHRLKNLLASFAHTATEWLAKTLPRYAGSWQLDLVSFRPEEEATRKLRLKARNDLLHVDAFPSRPTNGKRILRLFVNINPTQPRIWVTTEPFAKLLERFGEAAGLPTADGPGWVEGFKTSMLQLFRPDRPRRSPYDSFMLRFHDFMKANEAFQEHTPKRKWSFPPGSLWLAMTDTASHAVLRGRFALEHSYFIPPHALALPNESPAALLERACGLRVLNRAA
jgi:hypothetical protein